jgi:hypothetical protein
MQAPLYGCYTAMRYLLEEEIMYKYIPRAMLSILCLAVLAIATISCININMPQTPAENKSTPGDQALPPASTELPAIESFSASPETVLEGKSSTLSWSVQNATAITIIPDIGPVAATGSKTVKPPAATTYTLVASNAAGMQSRAVSINVVTVRRQIGLDLIDTKRPDLVVSEITVKPGPLVSGIACTVRNSGTDSSTPCKLLLLVDGKIQVTVPINAIAPGGVIESNLGYLLTPAQELHTFEVRVDSDNTVVESDENNNSRIVQLHFK